MAALLAFSGSGRTAGAAQFYWDNDGQGAVGGGSGVWDASSPRWSPTPAGSVYAAWPNTGSDEANFTSAGGGAILVNDAIVTSGLHITSGTWQFLTGLTGSFNTGSPGIFDTPAGTDLQLIGAVTGASGVTKIGAGTLSIITNSSGSNPAGTWNINQGTVAVKTDATGLTGKDIVINPGATLDLGHSFISVNSLNGDGIVNMQTQGAHTAQPGARFRFGVGGADMTYSGMITGFGRIDRVGVGTMNWNGINTFAGDSTLRSLNIDNSGQAFSDSFPVWLQGTAGTGSNLSNIATLRLGANETVGSLGGGSATSAGMLDTNGHTFTVGGDNQTNQYSGVMTGAGLFKKIGSGVQTIGIGNIAGSAGYTGKYEVAGGKLVFAPNTLAGGDGNYGAAPGAPDASYFTLSGGELATGIGAVATNTTTGTGNQTGNMLITANRGIAVIANSGLSAYNTSPRSTATYAGQITGSANLTSAGSARVFVNGDNALSYSGNWIVNDGALGTSATVGSRPFGTGSITLTGAGLVILPDATANLQPVIDVAPGGALTYNSSSSMTVGKGSNTNLTVNIGNLTRGTDGTMLIYANSGVANLGSGVAGEIIKVTGTAPTNTNGILPGFFGATAADSSTGDLLTYDNTFGIRGATYSSTDITTSGANDTVNQTSSVTLAAPASAYALRVSGSANLNLGGNTLSMGATPGTVSMIINPGSSITNGTVNLGGRDLAVYAANTAGTNTATFTNGGSLTKTGAGAFVVGSPMSYTGKTYIGAGQIQLNVDQALPATTDVVLSGNAAGSTNSAGDQRGVLNLNGHIQNVNSLSGNTGGDLIFGANGMLKITGNANTTFLGGTGGTGSGTSTLWNAGGGRLQLGPMQPTATSMGIGLGGKSMSLNRIWVTNGSTVALGSSAYTPNAPSSPDPLTVLLDNGTLQINSDNIASSISAGTSTASFTMLSGNRGMTIGAGGGTIDIPNINDTVSFATAANFQAASIANTISGNGLLTKTGAGTMLINIGNTFSGKWNIVQGLVSFTADSDGEFNDPLGTTGPGSGSGFGIAPPSFVADGVTLNGGGLYSNGDGIINKNRGFTIGPNGGTLFIGGEYIFNSKISGPGDLLVIRTDNGGSTSKNVSFNADNNTFHNMTVKSGYIMLNGQEAGGTGTITLDGSTEGIGIGKNEGPDSTSSTPIVMTGTGLIDIRTSSDSSPVLGSIFNGQPTGKLTLAGKISGSTSFFKGKSTADNTYAVPPTLGTVVSRPTDGEVILSNSTNDFTGNFTILTGTATVAANNALGSTAGSTFVSSLGTLGFQGGINYTANENVIISGTGGFGPDNTGAINNISGVNTFAGNIAVASSATINIASGSLTTGSIHGQSPLTVQGASIANFLGAQNVRTSGLNISSGAVKITPSSLAPGVSVVRSGAGGALQLSSGPLDITNNKLVTTDAVGSYNGSNYTDTTGFIATGRNGGSWNGTSGITTSMPNGNLFAIGIATAQQVKGLANPTDTSTWAGQTVTGSDALVMYTYGGDANLDGKINVDDYGRIDSSIPLGIAGWYNGDFNYDGKINVDDYGIIDSNIGIQGAPFFTAGGASGASAASGLNGVSAVPEPATFSILSLGAATLIGRRRRRKQA